MTYQETYQVWKDALTGTEYEAELALTAKSTETLQDSFYKEMEFGTAGMRGIIGMGTNRMNIFTVKRATQALANNILAHGDPTAGVAIAYDTRKNSDLFARETAGVLCANGISVFMYDTPHSVPQLSFTILELKTTAGVVITASHNPPEYNGYKVYGDDGGQCPVADSDRITQYISQIDDIFHIESMPLDEAERKGLLTYIGKDLDEIYFKKVEALCIHPEIIKQQADKLNIIYTPLHGTGNIPVRRVLKDLGVDNLHVVPGQEHPDPAFPTVKAPNPEERQCFDLAIELANQKDANLILATDPDSDRLGVAIRNTEHEFVILTGNQIGCLLMDYVLSQKQKTFSGDEFVVKSIVTSDMVDVIAKHYGVELRSVFTGFKFIAEQIKLSERTGKGKFIFGFEESYGYLQGAFVRDKDAVQAAMMIAEAACWYHSLGRTLYEALIDIYEKYGWFEELVVSKTLYGKEGIEKIQNAVRLLRDKYPEKIGDFHVIAVRDYLKQERFDMSTGKAEPIDMEQSNVLYFELDGGRFIIRPSGTEPKLKSYLSAFSMDRQQAEYQLDQLKVSAVNLIDKLTE
ncbi:phospho-sugar mutase [Christensenella tenuis]|uniref:Phosphoglucomutase n=1 Tax=Christensenella tenuis TaxID=2763033 RepID=A0ABR7EC54_9FIRM|nr:phospho-sugar mutase [Christensenella tenuis]MBC5647354.1 phospho-sugar mutase [Christensenella tenuis]